MKIFTKRNAIIGGGAVAVTGITIFSIKKIRARKRAANGTPTPAAITVNAPQKRGIWPFRKEVATPVPAPMPTEA